MPAHAIFPIVAVLDDLADRQPTYDAHPLSLTDGDQRSLAEALAAVPDPRRRGGR